ncbi:hypothetical protein JCM3774_001221 [Rhodotorula dairenensis]
MPWIPTPSDGLDASDTLRSQYETEQSISALLTEQLAKVTPAVLDLDTHVAYCRRLIDNPLPNYFVGLDASRPWVLYWVFHSLNVMGRPIDAPLRARAAATLAAFQNEGGGFGGGPGQLSHLAPTYAAVCALAYAGEEGWAVINRPAMYQFLLSLKQTDGSFIMHVGGEVDVRGSYCALTVATLLNLLTPELTESTADFVASCQTYEGGLAAAAFSATTAWPDAPAAPLGEAHGGYAYCAAASWAMVEGLSTSLPARDRSGPSTLDGDRCRLNVMALLRWSASMQANPIEGGGFRGRTNKLVDGCYSWWCGGLLPIVKYLLEGHDDTPAVGIGELYDEPSLRQYVELVAQAPGGGLRDKPGKSPDAYHTCYNLSGASSAASRPVFSRSLYKQLAQSFQTASPAVEGFEDGDRAGQSAEERRRCQVYSRSLAWRLGGPPEGNLAEPENALVFTHPLFNVCMPAVQAIMAHFYGQAG